jgi:hypothetical protein
MVSTIMFASWCGMPMQTDEITACLGWQNMVAMRVQQIYEIPGKDILQPGFRLVYGYGQIKRLLTDNKRH